MLTTLQCNFACDYCIQGDHGDYNKPAAKMSIEMAARRRRRGSSRALDAIAPERLVAHVLRRRAAAEHAGALLPVRAVHARAARRAACSLLINIITNGLLLTREMVERLNPLGLNGIKITLDGDRDAHNRIAAAARRAGHVRPHHRQHPRRRRPAPASPSAATSTTTRPTATRRCSTSWPAQDFAPRLAKVNFKPVIREEVGAAEGHHSR